MPRLMLQVMLIPIIWLYLLMRIKLKEWLLMRITESSMKELLQMLPVESHSLQAVFQQQELV